MCTVSNNTANSRLNSYIYPYSFIPLASKAQIKQPCGRYCTKETDISRQHSAARHSNAGKPEDAPQQYSDVTPYGRRAIFVSGDVRFQDGDAIDIGKLEGWGALFSLFLLSSSVSLTLAYFAIRYTHRTTVVLRYNILCDIRVLFMHDASQCAWRIAPIRFNNVRLSLFWFLYQIY